MQIPGTRHKCIHDICSYTQISIIVVGQPYLHTRHAEPGIALSVYMPLTHSQYRNLMSTIILTYSFDNDVPNCVRILFVNSSKLIRLSTQKGCSVRKFTIKECVLSFKMISSMTRL